jgi:hypothetical protein
MPDWPLEKAILVTENVSKIEPSTKLYEQAYSRPRVALFGPFGNLRSPERSASHAVFRPRFTPQTKSKTLPEAYFG